MIKYKCQFLLFWSERQYDLRIFLCPNKSYTIDKAISHFSETVSLLQNGISMFNQGQRLCFSSNTKKLRQTSKANEGNFQFYLHCTTAFWACFGVFGLKLNVLALIFWASKKLTTTCGPLTSNFELNNLYIVLTCQTRTRFHNTPFLSCFKGLFMRKRKRHCYQIGSKRIHFNVYIDKDKRKNFAFSFTFVQCEWTLSLMFRRSYVPCGSGRLFSKLYAYASNYITWIIQDTT